ncbi:MAG: hypothetical protein DRH30_00865 [Deltaproteobacteria bacterium]|nr:MAG: hypothetical protein DRH30_00865 [Deltaproteobacteria bacterium]
MPDTAEELEALASKYAGDMNKAVRRVIASVGKPRMEKSVKLLESELAEVMGRAHMAGRVSVLRTVASAAPGVLAAKGIPKTAVAVTRMSTRELLRRVPMVAESAMDVTRLIEQGAFTAARASTQSIVQRVQLVIADSLEQGQPTPDTSALLADTEAWSRAYSENVVRTTQSRAYDDGAVTMTSNPAVRVVVPAFRFDATRDSNVRPNHWAAHGFIAAVDSPEWLRRGLIPPLGFQCRCVRSFVTRSKLKRMGLIDKNGRVITHRPRSINAAGPDQGFTQ